MAVDSFIPKLWASALEVPFRKSLVYSQPGIANTRFQSALAGGGKSVTINTIGAGQVRTHDRTVNLTYDDVSTTEVELVMDQERYYGFRVSDADKVQAAGDFQGAATEEHAEKMANEVDTFIAKQLASGAGKKIGSTKVFDGADYYVPTSGQITAWDTVRAVAAELDKVSAPTGGRWLVVGPKFASALLADRRLTDAASTGTDVVARNGLIGSIPILGINVYTSLNAPTVSTRETLIAGVPNSLDFATQLRTMEAFRDPDRFGDIVRGLQIFGANVTRPTGVVTAEADVLPGVIGGAGAPAGA